MTQVKWLQKALFDGTVQTHPASPKVLCLLPWSHRYEILTDTREDTHKVSISPVSPIRLAHGVFMVDKMV